MNAIEVNELTRNFGNFCAVDHLSFTVEPGAIFGFLGANGAGKSTTIRMLCGLLSPSSGDAWVNGYHITRDIEKLRGHIGYMSQRFSLYNDLSVDENLRFFGGVYGLSPSQCRHRIDETLELLSFTGHRQALTASLPGGLKQRIALAAALLHQPGIIFLDEPTGGVDPVSRRQFWELINTIAHAGTTVLVTTHYLDEAEFCNQIIMIQNGRLVAQGAPQNLKTQTIPYPMVEISCQSPMAVGEKLKEIPYIKDISLFGKKIHLQLDQRERIERELPTLLRSLACDNFTIEPLVPSLEDVFIHLIDTHPGGA